MRRRDLAATGPPPGALDTLHRRRARVAAALLLGLAFFACGKYGPPRRAPDAAAPPPPGAVEAPTAAVEAGPGEVCEDPEAKRR